jgi:hypothetical protein
MHLRQGSSWVLSPTPETETRVQMWREVHALQTEIFRRGVESSVFVNESPAFLARLFSAMDQVLLADWVESGMSADQATYRKIADDLRGPIRDGTLAPGDLLPTQQELSDSRGACMTTDRRSPSLNGLVTSQQGKGVIVRGRKHMAHRPKAT